MADENNKKEPSVDGEATKGFPILLLPLRGNCGQSSPLRSPPPTEWLIGNTRIGASMRRRHGRATAPRQQLRL